MPGGWATLIIMHKRVARVGRGPERRTARPGAPWWAPGPSLAQMARQLWAEEVPFVALLVGALILTVAVAVSAGLVALLMTLGLV